MMTKCTMKYVADDGKEFSSCSECVEYEKKLAKDKVIKEKMKNIKFFNADGEQIFPEDGESFCAILNQSDSVLFSDEASVEFVRQQGYNEFDVGCWYYCREDGGFILVDDAITIYKEFVQEYEEKIKFLYDLKSRITKG